MKLDYIQIIPGITFPSKLCGKIAEAQDYRAHFVGWKRYNSQIKGSYEVRISINFILFCAKFIFSRIASEQEIEKQFLSNIK